MLQKWCQKAYLVFYWPAELHCCSKSVLPVMHQRSTWGTKLMLVLPVSEQTGILQIYPVPRNALCCTTFRQVRFVLVVWVQNNNNYKKKELQSKFKDEKEGAYLNNVYRAFLGQFTYNGSIKRSIGKMKLKENKHMMYS